MYFTCLRLFLAAALIFSVSSIFAQDVSFEEIVRGNLKNMTKLSGTFDLYDSEVDQIRNLRMLEILSDIKKEGDDAFVPVRFRDINTGDIVIVEVNVKMISEGRYDSQWKIKEVQKLVNNTSLKENYTDEEIQHVMRDYYKKQSKFSFFSLFS